MSLELRPECGVCGSALARYVCSMCGCNVCIDDYDKALGVCIVCKQKRKV